jgi:hypothetical protein
MKNKPKAKPAKKKTVSIKDLPAREARKIKGGQKKIQI